MLYAREEAALHGHDYIGCEPLFGGCIRANSDRRDAVAQVVDVRVAFAEAMALSSKVPTAAASDNEILLRRSAPYEETAAGSPLSSPRTEYPRTPRAARVVARLLTG